MNCTSRISLTVGMPSYISVTVHEVPKIKHKIPGTVQQEPRARMMTALTLESKLNGFNQD